MTMWMVRARGGALFQKFMERSAVAIGWHQTGDISGLNTYELIKDKVDDVWPGRANGYRAGCLHRLKNEISDGGHVITYDPSRRIYAVGVIADSYKFDPEFDSEFGLQHTRAVKWNEKEVVRDDLPRSARNSLASGIALFLLPQEVEKAIFSVLSGQVPVVSDETDSVEDEENILEDIEEKSKEFIKDQIIQLEWDDAQELVAGLLRAKGYQTVVSRRGPDRGKDIVASPDGFGFEDPRIVVEVKHRQGQADSKDIRGFLGGRHANDRGLFVSTGGFSKDSKYEADRANIPLTLLDIDDLVDSVIKNYDNMDVETRSLLPLKRIYWPT